MCSQCATKGANSAPISPSSIQTGSGRHKVVKRANDDHNVPSEPGGHGRMEYNGMLRSASDHAASGPQEIEKEVTQQAMILRSFANTR
eukprot:714573-Amphidinium_carterae.1